MHRAGLLADNIELDRKLAALAEQALQTEAAVNRLAAEEARMREALAATEDELKQLRLKVEEAHTNRSQIEVELVRRQAELKYLDETSRKELNCRRRGTGRRRRDRSGHAKPSPKPSGSTKKCARASKRSVR